jgi:glycosyltransferase involved in cell wall biosynthesis
MIYICVPTYNNAKTVGLLLWKVRQVLAEFPRDYQLLVVNDGSNDSTEEVLRSYAHVLPLSVTTYPTARGYSATVEELLRQALRNSDRPKRDCAIVINGDFSVSPGVLPEMIKSVESGADLVVGEANRRSQSFGRRLLQRVSAWLLRPGVQMPGVEDLLSGVCAIRLVTLKRCLRDGEGALLQTEGVCARAELLARAGACARQITALPLSGTHLRNGSMRGGLIGLAMQLFRAGRALSIPRPEAAVRRAT